MRGIVVRQFGEPEELRVEDLPEPEPGPGEVKVRIEAAGVNPVETYQRAGTYAVLPSLPYTPGTDGAGTVVATGDGVTEARVGDRVFLYTRRSGTYAEYAVSGAREVFPLPDGVRAAEGAALGIPYATAYHALIELTPARPGDILLVHGASGAVGTALVQFGRMRGMRVLGTSSTAEGRAYVTSLGAFGAFDHDDAEGILAATEGHGADVIVEMLANRNLGRDFTLLAIEGTVVVVGSRGDATVNPRDLMGRRGTLKAFTLTQSSADDVYRMQLGVAAALRGGYVRPHVDRTYALTQAAEAHRAVLAGGIRGKIVLEPGREA